MTNVDRLGGLLAQIRNSLLAKTERNQKSRKTSSASSPRAASQSAATSTESVKSGLLSHLSQLDLNAEGDMQRARQIFVELVLVSEFGAQVASDARFSQMARKVEQAMTIDPAISSELSELLREIATAPPQ